MLEQYPLLKTYDAEEMEAAIKRAYNGRIVEFPDGDESFYGQANDVQLGEIGLTFCSYGSAVRLAFGESEHVRQQIALSASAVTTIGEENVLTSPKQSCIIPSSKSIKTSFDEGYRQLVVRLHPSLISRKAEAILGERPGPVLDLELSANFESQRSESFRRLVLFLARELSDPHFSMPPLLASEFEQAIAVSFLYANQSSLTSKLHRPIGNVAPWQVQRVEDYIRANWGRPITIEELANETGASVRAIFKAFREYRGYTPMSYLKKVRLDEARSLLVRADDKTSVSQIAFACGFLNLGHFARDYRLEYGELPSETLRSTRGR
ncbi:MAG: AraC family transcriptional regulator [Rhizobiaceae bacterium]